jgi:DNA-binding transcriptional ArsR family regulator
MSFIEKYKKLEALHQLIKMKATGKPEQLAQRLQLSRRTLYNHLDELRDFGANIEYCRQRETFEYLEQFDFCLTIELNTIRGGAKNNNNFIFRANYLHGICLSLHAQKLN